MFISLSRCKMKKQEVTNMSILGKRGIKKTAVILCTTAMLVTFGGCGNTDSGETPGSASESADAQKDYSNQTVIGQVKAIEGTK